MIILFNMKFWLKSKVGISIFHISWIWHQVQTPNAQQIVRHFNYMLHVLNFCLYPFYKSGSQDIAGNG